MQKYKILKIKSYLINPIKFELMVEEYHKQFIKKVSSVDNYSYLYFKKSISDKRLVKIYNNILK